MEGTYSLKLLKIDFKFSCDCGISTAFTDYAEQDLHMHDIKFIRKNPDDFDAALAKRGEVPLAQEIVAIDEKRRQQIFKAEHARSEQKASARQAGQAKAAGDEAKFNSLRQISADRKSDVARLQNEADAEDTRLTELLLAIPNLPEDDVPIGVDETENVEIRRWGEPRVFEFKPAEHFDIRCAQIGMDFKTAAKLSGARFVLMSGAVARLHRAIAQFMIDMHVERNGFTEVWTPVLVRETTMLGTGQLPKLGDDAFQTTDGRWLIPTAEVTLTNIVRDSRIEEDYLPRRYCAHTQCFRSESGAAGKDTTGMLRQHQFEKVEMVAITKPESSREEQERMTRCAEGVLEALELPYRTVLLCTGDMGFGARKTFDIEVWLPGQEKYREISSVSNCGDFQARRMNARYRPKGGNSLRFVHTLNGSGLAVGRTLIAVLENHQCEDGGVDVPAALHPYLGGRSVIAPDGELL